ncbi:hypothetical protein U9M48_015158 [Paspalum notatum var. saurae]|uniref:MOSC domain-containing protein n=1 Tax=Paspalum notatum var. saurae TaxID=547442 RepID=A0AAQ3WLK9_PASNO
MDSAASFLSSLFGGGGSGAPAATVKAILVYPIKSCRGISVPQAPVTATGFRWDRQWMLVNSKGRAITQRVEPKLALVEVEMPPEAFAEDWQPTPDDHMVIRAPGMKPLSIPLAAKCATIDDVSPEWFSTYLGNPTRLVRFKEESETRLTDPDYARGYEVMFSDGFPFLIISQGSLDALNEMLKEPVPINRFRPNILVEGCQPYAEDLWKTVKINKLTFLGVKLCGRCKVPTINQDNGIPSPTEPTKTLQTYRSGEVLLPSHKNKRQVYFGQNAVCKESLSANGKGKIVKIGDPVYVMRSFSSSNEVPTNKPNFM